MVMLVPKSAKGPSNFPSGSWSYGPLTIQWSITSSDGLDVKVLVSGFQVDELTGTLTSNGASLSDDLNVLETIKGHIELTAKYDQGPNTNGLWISGEIKAGPWDSGILNYRIIAW